MGVNYKTECVEVSTGGRLSYQYHEKFSEAWTIVADFVTITLDGKVKDYQEEDTIFIPQGVKHRVENKSKKKVVFVEVQTERYFGKDDILRLDDDYYNRI